MGRDQEATSFGASAVVCRRSFADCASVLHLQPFLDAVSVVVVTAFQLSDRVLEFVILLQPATGV